MMMLAITAVLIGAVLGMRFKILILLPATVIGSSATLGVGVAHSDGFWSILLAMVLAIAALQVGYLAGTVVIALQSRRQGFACDRRGGTKARWLSAPRIFNQSAPLKKPMPCAYAVGRRTQ